MIRTLYNNQKKRLCCSLSRFPSLLVCRAGRDVVFVVGAKRPLLLVSQSSGDGVVASGVVLTGSPVSSTPLASRVVLTAGVPSASVSGSGLCARVLNEYESPLAPNADGSPGTRGSCTRHETKKSGALT